MSYLTVKHLSKHYGSNPVFNDIDFSADEGEFVTLLGPSGCGKSTLLRCLSGLTDVDSGEIRLHDRDISHVPPQKREIGMVFQNYALFPNMTVSGNIAFGLRMQRLAKAEIKTLVLQMLQLVELTELADRYPNQLSGGQRQRVALARSLITRPRLLLLDEPLSALDARIRRHLREQIRRIQQELNLTTIFVTHDQEEALTLSDRIVLMDNGRIVQNDRAETLYMRPANLFAAGFIGHYNLLTAEEATRLTGRHCSSSLAIRPESIRLSVQETGSTQELAAEVTGYSLLGNILRYNIHCREVELVVDVLNNATAVKFSPGQQVQLHIDLSCAQEVA